MLENRVNITSLHPCFPVTCNIGEDKKKEYQTAKKTHTFRTPSFGEPKTQTGHAKQAERAKEFGWNLKPKGNPQMHKQKQIAFWMSIIHLKK